MICIDPLPLCVFWQANLYEDPNRAYGDMENNIMENNKEHYMTCLGNLSMHDKPYWKVRNSHAEYFRRLFFTLILYAKACDVLTPKT